jgi:hypothetical protein
MTNGWDGSDPSQQNDGAGAFYELATRFTANADITISAVRVWAGTSLSVSGRDARIWTTAGVVQRTIDIDDSLPSGWTTYDLSTSLDVADGGSFDVSYSTQQYYGAVAGGYPNDSSDANVTATAGRFAETMETFPTTVTSSFYGIDIVYTLTGGNQAPDITGMTIVKSDLTIAATVTVDDEAPSTVTVHWDWGDGTTTNTGAGVVTANHTYTESGNYAVLATATDTGGLTGSFARAVNITVSATAESNEQWLADIFDAVVSDVQRSGYFEKVNTHEPKRGPRNGLTAALWLQAIDPIALASGLASTSARIVFTLRLFQNFIKEPQDMIDPDMAKAAANLVRRYHDDFDFEGAIRNIDLLGAFGVALAAQSGYLEIDSKNYRIIDITIPCIVNDVWPQVS